MLYVYLLGVVLLICLYTSFLDIKYRKVDNFYIFLILLAGIFYRYINKEYYSFIFLLIFVIVGYAMWFFRLIGGADAKLMMTFSLVLPYSGFANAYVVSVLFLIVFMLIYLIYTGVYRLNKGSKLTKEDDRVPGFPIFLIALIITYLINIH